jgi:hypothetical protein
MSDFIPIHDSLDTLPQMGNVEVDQKAHRAAAQLQIRDQPGRVEGQQLFNRLDLDDDAVFDQEVDSIASLEGLTAIDNREANLVFHVQATQSEFVQETGGVGAFE